MNIEEIVNVLESGGLVLAPSDTVYGILGDASNEDTINKVFEAKQRNRNKSLILLVNGLSMLNEYVENITPLEEELINKFWPGKLTIIFKKNNKVSNLLTGGKNTIAVRFPNNDFLLEIISKINRPLFSTSANISNNKTITSTSNIDSELLDYIDLVVDGGEINASSSTIVICENDNINILRDGELSEKILKWNSDK